MKNILIIILFTIGYSSFGQIATLDLTNPAPRIGEDIEIIVYFKTKELEKKEGPQKVEKWLEDQKNNLGKAEIKFYENFLDTGLVKIGPFSFSIGSNQFTTDVMTIRIYPDLPVDKDGIWIRQVQFKNESFLILEQRISNQWRQESKSADEHSMTHDSDRVNYTELDVEKLKEIGLHLKQLSSSSSSQVVDKNDVFGAGMVSYKLTKYKVTNLSNFKGRLKLKKDFFIDYPDKVELPAVLFE